MSRTETAEAARHHGSRLEIARVAVVVAILSTLYVVVASVHGAFGAARNDDWSYYRVVFDFARDWHFHVDNWIQTMLVGHTLLGWPIVKAFGQSIRALQALSVVAGGIAIICSYALIRRFLSPRWSSVVCLTLLLGPVFASLAVSYMTDTTSFAAQSASLLAGARALECRHPSRVRWWLITAAVFGFVGVSIREYAIVAFAAVVIVAARRSSTDPRARSQLAAITILFAVATVILFAWRRSLPLSVSPALNTHPRPGEAKKLIRAATTLGFFISPVALTMSPRRVVSRAWATHRALTLITLAAVTTAIMGAGSTLLGNYVTERGSYPGTAIVRTSPELIPRPLFALAVVLGDYAVSIAVLVSVCALSNRHSAIRRSTRAVLGDGSEAPLDIPALTLVRVYAVALSALYVVVTVALRESFFDRYLIPLVPFVGALLVVAGQRYELQWARRSLRAASIALLIFGIVGFVYVDAAATIDGAK